MWSTYEIIHIWTAVKVKNDHRSAMIYQLSYEATYWERGQFIEFISSREEWSDVKYIRPLEFLLSIYELNGVC